MYFNRILYDSMKSLSQTNEFNMEFMKVGGDSCIGDKHCEFSFYRVLQRVASLFFQFFLFKSLFYSSL